ncbi:hypothetical protein F5Y13DRAFT_189854 [Hypoxylon sp. FL1857]|nr:hypothetical protein F5Y13DRAFT_189854 [Hypoxylon sp. FL1857]
MDNRPVPVFLQDGRNVADQITHSLQGVVNFAANVQGALDEIKDNTKGLYWWSAIFVIICLGLFLLAQLVSLRKELSTLVRYQEIFRGMWNEDKENEVDRADELRRQTDLEERRRRVWAAARARGAGRSPSGGRDGAGGPSPFGPAVDAALDSAPPPGPERDEWARRLAALTQEFRRAQQERQEQEDTGNDAY